MLKSAGGVQKTWRGALPLLYTTLQTHYTTLATHIHILHNVTQNATYSSPQLVIIMYCVATNQVLPTYCSTMIILQ